MAESAGARQRWPYVLAAAILVGTVASLADFPAVVDVLLAVVALGLAVVALVLAVRAPGAGSRS